ncbi:hypothetical protein GCM10027062_28480 [Nocardioides hungaricus]
MPSSVTTEVVVYVLTALAAVVVLLTRLRLGRGGGAGRLQMGKGLLNVHTVAGVAALGTWVAFLVLGNELVGIIALALWWVVVVAGLGILVRWLPSRGRHASAGQEDRWSAGPGLSILAHVGMLVGVGVFTWAYLNSAV